MAIDIKHGKVSVTYPAECSARVAFDDQQGVVSAKLPIMVFGSGKNKHYWMPDVGDSVIVIVPEHGTNGDGFILGEYYSENNPPECTSQDKHRIYFSNGDYIEHNRSTGDLNIKVSGNIKINGARIDLNT